MRIVLGGGVKNKLSPFTDLPSATTGVRFQSQLSGSEQHRRRHDTSWKAPHGVAELGDHFASDTLRDSSDVIAFVFSTMGGNQTVLRTSLGQVMLWFFAAA